MTDSILKAFVKDNFPNDFEELKKEIDAHNIYTLIDVRKKLSGISQAQVIELFEKWVSNRFVYEHIENIFDLLEDTYEEWSDDLNWYHIDEYYYLQRLTIDDALKYEVIKETSTQTQVVRTVEIEFLTE